MSTLKEIEARVKRQEAELTVEDEAEGLLYWVNCFHYHICSGVFDEKDDEIERDAFRYSIEKHIENLKIALSNKRWFYNPRVNEMANH